MKCERQPGPVEQMLDGLSACDLAALYAHLSELARRPSRDDELTLSDPEAERQAAAMMLRDWCHARRAQSTLTVIDGRKR